MSTPSNRTAPASRVARDREMLRGAALTGAAKWISQALSWASTLIVARLLSPDDYGVVGTTMIFVMLVQIVGEFGLGAAVVANRDLSEDQLGGLSSVSLLLGAALGLLSFLAADSVADFYRRPDIAPVLRVLSVTFLTTGMLVVPRALLTRGLQYGRLAVIDAVESLATILTTITLAVNGAGYWSLALGTVAGRLAATGLTLSYQPMSLRSFRRFEVIRGPLRVGAHVAAGGIGWYMFRTADSNLVSRYLGVETYGFYSMALAFATLPLDRLNELVNRVMPGILSDVQQEPAELERYLRLVSQALSLVGFPIAVGLALVAGDLIPVLLGQRWAPAAAPLQLLALSALVRSLVPVLTQTLVITGHSARSMRATFLAVVVMVPAFMFAVQHGLRAVAATWLIAYPAVMIPALVIPALRAGGVSVRAYLSALRPAAESSAVMAVLVLGAHWGLLRSVSPPWRLAFEVLIGVVSYAASLALMHRTSVMQYLSWFSGLRGGHRTA